MYIKEVKRIENAYLCGVICGGRCCKSVPCSYFPEDFGDPPTMETLLKKINSGRATLLRVEGYERRMMISRTRDRGVVDIISREEWILNGGKMAWLRECAFLTPQGCGMSLEDRPSAGAVFVPKFIEGTKHCYMPISVQSLWDPYQPLLAELEEYLLAEQQKSPGRF